MERSGEALDSRQQNQLYQLLLGFSDVFSLSSENMGRANRMKHTIPTTTEYPIGKKDSTISMCRS